MATTTQTGEPSTTRIKLETSTNVQGEGPLGSFGKPLGKLGKQREREETEEERIRSPRPHRPGEAFGSILELTGQLPPPLYPLPPSRSNESLSNASSPGRNSENPHWGWNPPPRRPLPSPPGPPGPPGSPPSHRSQGTPAQPPQNPAGVLAMVPPRDPKEKGRRPDEFTKREDYSRFGFQLTIFMAQNESIYSTDSEKILFTLGFFTAGVPLTWATRWLEEVARKVPIMGQSRAFGSWNNFKNEIQETFEDPNIAKNEMIKFEELKYDPRQPIPEFLQEYELIAGRAKITDDRTLIHQLEKKVPAELIKRVYDGQQIPEDYQGYRERILTVYALEKQLASIRKSRVIAFPTTTTASVPPQPSSSKERRKSTNFHPRGRGSGRPLWKARAQVESPERDVDKETCFLCKKKGHWKKDCPKMKRIHQLRGLYDKLSSEEKELMEQDF